MNNVIIGVVKSDDYTLDDINQRGWCFDYEEYKDGLYFVWFNCPLDAALEDIKEYSLLEINNYDVPVMVHHNGNIMSIQDVIDNRHGLYQDYLKSSGNYEYGASQVSEWLEELADAKEEEKYLDRKVIGSAS